MQASSEVSARLRPHWIQRIAVLVPGIVVSAAGFSVWANSPSSATLALMLVGGSLYGAVRWVAFAGVSRRGDILLVSGLVWSRRIPLRQIDRVTKGYVTVHWHSRNGHRVATPVTALWSEPRPMEIVTQYSNERVNEIRSWVRSASAAGPKRSEGGLSG